MNRPPTSVLALALCISTLASAQPASGFLDALDDDTPVRLAWSDVLQLLERARRADPAVAPLEYAVGPGKVTGEVQGKALALALELPVTLYTDGWVALPLLETGTVRAALLDGRPAAIAREEGRSALIAKGRGDHRLRLDLVLPLVNPGAASLGFGTPVPLHWRLELPGTDAHVEPAARQSVTRGAGDRVLLEALTLPAAAVQLDWSGVKASQVSTRASAESLTFVSFQEGTTSGQAHFAFEISGARKDRLAVRLPAALELLSVTGEDVAGWSVEPVQGGKRLLATLRRPRLGSVALDLSFELPPPGGDGAELPSLYAEEVEDQRGYLAASAASPLSMTHRQVAGGELMDAKHLPAHLLRGVKVPFTLAYRHGGNGFTARVQLERNASVALAQATIDAAYYTTVLTDDGREVVKATFLVKNNLRPYLAVALPEGATLWAAFVSGEPVNPAREEASLLLPLVKSREAVEGDTLASHTMEEGWSLSDVALHYYHDASKWRLIQQANDDVLNGSLEPQRGQMLRIPRLSGPGGSDLETAFPVELVYSREAATPGRLGRLDLQLAVPDLGVMRAVWTVYLPSRLDPLSFEGNFSQASYIRYGLLRRLKALALGPSAVLAPSPLVGTALAGDGGYLSSLSLRKRFSKFELDEAGGEEAARHPRDSLPLVGRAYVFKRYLLEGEQPRLSAVYMDRALEPPVRTLALALGFALCLLLGRVASGPDRRRALAVGGALAAYAVAMLLVGHFVLGTHGRAALGVLLGSWVYLLSALRRRVREEAGWRRSVARALLVLNGLMLCLVVFAGIGPRTGLFAVLLAAAGWLVVWRAPAKAVTTAAAIMGLVLGATAPLPARAGELPPRAEVTVPLGKLKELLREEPARPPPRNSSFLSASYRGTLGKENLELEGDLEVEVLSEDWVRLPLVPLDVALTAVAVDGRPASVSTAGAGAYALVLRGAGRHRVRLTFVVPVREPGVLPLGLVPGVASTLTLRLPSADLEPELSGASAVTVSGATITALVPADGKAELRWSVHPPAPDREAPATAEELRMTARTLQIVSINEQRVRIYALVRYRLQRGSTHRFTVELPDTVELLDVAAPGMEDHQVVNEGGRRVLAVTTGESVRDELELSFVCDWRAGKEGGALPVFTVPGVRSETGTLGLEAAGSMEVRMAEVSGAAAQVDVRSAPELFAHTDKPILHAIRYLRQPYGVKLAFVRHPEVELETATVDRAEYTTVIAADGRAITQGVFKMRNARRAFLGVTLPAASEVQSVLVGGAPAQPVRDPRGTLLLPLLRSASSDREMRQFEVEVVYLTRLSEPGTRAVLPPLLPAIDLRASKMSWALHVPPGTEVARAPGTEEATDSMQWATAPRAALYATRGLQTQSGEAAAGGGGLLPVRFNLPTHGEPTTFWLHYVPAGVAPQLKVAYAPRSLPPAVQALGALVALALVAGGVLGARRWRRGAAVRASPG